MKANTYRAYNGTLLLDESNPFTAENEAEKAMIFHFKRIMSEIGCVGGAICDGYNDNEERSVFDRLDLIESKLDAIIASIKGV